MEILQPKLRFPEFEDDWNNFTLEQLTDKVGDGLHGTPEYVDNSDVYFINGNNLIDGKIVISESSKKVSLETFTKNDKGLNSNSILISINGTIGSISRYNNEKVMLGKSVGYFNFKQSKDFYFYILQSNKIQDYFVSELTGSTIKNLSLKTLRETIIYQPTLEEQTKIANFLSSVDEKLNLLKEKKELLEEYKKGIMQKIFNQEIRFKDDNGNDFEDWEEKTFGEMSTIRRGASPRPITDPKWFDSNSEIGWVRISDVSKSNKYLSKTEQYLSEEGVNKSRLVKKGNLIMSICATIGKPIYTDFDVCIHDGFVVFENLKGYREYFYYYLQYIQKNWYNYGQPGTQINLNSDIVSSELLLFPSIEEQTKIANFLSAIDEKIELVSNQIQDTQEYKKGLLQQMFV